MSRRLLSTSRALPGLVSSMMTHCVHPGGAAWRMSSIAIRRAWSSWALSSASAAMRTSAATSRRRVAYRAFVAAQALAIQMPEKPPTPTPWRTRKRLSPFSMFSSVMSRAISARRLTARGWYSAPCTARRGSRASCVPSGIARQSVIIVAVPSRHFVHASSSSRAASVCAASVASTSASSRRSWTVWGHGAGRPSLAMSSCRRRAPAELAPRSWCMWMLSSCMARRTALFPVSAVSEPVRLMVRMPGRSRRGAVRLPAKAAFARPTARKHSHLGSRPSAMAELMSARSRVRMRSASRAPSETAASYLPVAWSILVRHASRRA